MCCTWVQNMVVLTFYNDHLANTDRLIWSGVIFLLLMSTCTCCYCTLGSEKCDIRPNFEQNSHYIHYFAEILWLTRFRSRPISCFLFIPGPTSFTWKHPISTDTQQHVCSLILSISTLTLLICKQALIVSRETCCRAHSVRAPAGALLL